MSVAGWLVVVAIAGAVAWLALALVGTVRELAAVRARLDAIDARSAPPRRELPVGALAPVWRIATADGEVVSSSTFAARRHLLVFADAGCRACDDLVPDMVAAAGGGAIPPVAVIGRGDASATPAAWRVADVRVRVGTERADEVSAAFGVDVTPTVVVVDEGGAVVARGPVATMVEVRGLVEGAAGVRIVAAGGA
jgi:Redoxin